MYRMVNTFAIDLYQINFYCPETLLLNPLHKDIHIY